jgi:hypothetical protein
MSPFHYKRYNRHVSVLHVVGSSAFTLMLDMLNIRDIKESSTAID